jgi:putative Holliday junction resolvase
MTILGIDYGLKNCGLAISAGLLTDPLCTVRTDTILSVLPSIISKQNIDTIVVGIPSGQIKKKALELSNQISAFFSGKVFPVDETLSSYLAVKSLLHTSVSRRRKLEHAAAAAIILQSWLDSRALNV